MFVNEQYLSVVRRPAQSKAGIMSELTQSLFTKINHTLQNQRQAENHKALNEAVSNILTTLEPYNPRFLRVTETENGSISEPLSFLSYLLNLEPTALRLPEMSIAEYLPSKRISFGKETFEVRGPTPNDVKLGAILSIKEYANGTGPGMLDGLLRLPHEFVLTQSFGFVDHQTSMNAMNEAERKNGLPANKAQTASLQTYRMPKMILHPDAALLGNTT